MDPEAGSPLTWWLHFTVCNALLASSSAGNSLRGTMGKRCCGKLRRGVHPPSEMHRRREGSGHPWRMTVPLSLSSSSLNHDRPEQEKKDTQSHSVLA